MTAEDTVNGNAKGKQHGQGVGKQRINLSRNLLVRRSEIVVI
jgi:hypothetical protein